MSLKEAGGVDELQPSIGGEGGERTLEGKVQATLIEEDDLYGDFEVSNNYTSPPENQAIKAPEPSGNTSSAPACTRERTAKPAAAPQDSKAAAAATVYIVNLQWWTTDAQLEALFGEFGEVVEVTFFEDEATGKSKGCAQVQMGSAQQAKACVQGLKGKVIDGKKCVVTLASPGKAAKRPAAAGRSRSEEPGHHPQGRRPGFEPQAEHMQRGPNFHRSHYQAQAQQMAHMANPMMGMASQPMKLPPMPPGMAGMSGMAGIPPLPPGMGMPMPGMPFPPGMMDAMHNAGDYRKRPRH